MLRLCWGTRFLERLSLKRILRHRLIDFADRSRPMKQSVADRERAASLIQLKTDRLELAPLRFEDSAELRILTDDTAITQAIDFLPSPLTQSDADALIARQWCNQEWFLGIRHRVDNNLVGVIGVHFQDPDEIETGYWIGTRFQGQGYATEALRCLVTRLKSALPNRRVIAECKFENRASWRVLEKVGFVSTHLPGKRAGRRRLVLNHCNVSAPQAYSSSAKQA